MSGTPIVPLPPGQTLLFDADDTLWENNIYFERAIAGFIDLLAHPTLSSAEVREHFNRMEHSRVQTQGYGTKSFRSSMAACLRDLAGRDCHAHEHARLDSLVRSIVTAPIELMPAVAPTLAQLAIRHRLFLVTKGDPEEQLDKLDRSGLAALFAVAEVVHEKHRDTYITLCTRYRLDPAITWMLGNSPKSDINPALAAGLHAVFLPHGNTWVLEHEDLNDPPHGQHLLHANNFATLLNWF